MKQALRAILQGSAAVTALVPAGSINWREDPQGNVLPRIVMHLINGSHSYTLRDVTDITDVRVQIDCWAASYAQADAIAEAVAARLSGYQAGAFYQVRLVGSRDAQASGSSATDEPPGVSLDFTFQYRRV